MACHISFKEQFVLLNNMQFSRLIDFGIEIGDQTASHEECPFVAHMVKLRDEVFWPGRGIDILEDFPKIAEQKFWSRVYYDTARAIFDRRVGLHEHSFWQSQSIHQAYATGQLFGEAVRDVEAGWFADTLDVRQFDDVVNRTKR